MSRDHIKSFIKALIPCMLKKTASPEMDSTAVSTSDTWTANNSDNSVACSMTTTTDPEVPFRY